MTQLPLATICIPLYNKKQFIAKTLEAVQRQTYPNLEVVVSDNGSNDGSETIAQEFARRDARIKYFRLQHTVSMNESWRYCYRLAQGDFVKLHSGDDHALQPDFLEKMIEPLLRRPEIGFTVCEVRPAITYMVPGISADGLVNCYRSIAAFSRDLTNTPDREERARKLLVRASLENQIGTPCAVVCRRSSLPYAHWKKTSGYWPESYADWDFMLRLFLDHRGFYVDDVTLSYHYDLGNGFSGILVDNLPDLNDKVFRLLMPFTILADPDMADLRRSARAEEIAFLMQTFQQRMSLVMESADHAVAFDHPHFTRKVLPGLTQLAEALRRNPNDLGVMLQLRKLRNGLVRHWMSANAERIALEYGGPHGQAQRLFLESGVRRFALATFEQAVLDQAVQNLKAKEYRPDCYGEVLTLMLLTDVRQIAGFHPGLIPPWLQADYDRYSTVV